MKDRLFILIQHLLPQHLLSRLVGQLAETRITWLKNLLIERFQKLYGVDLEEAQIEDPRAYPTFNAFFTRALKPEARLIDTTAEAIVSPADGCISQCGDIEYGRLFQAKGHGYSLTALLGGDHDRAEPFINGKFATIYLSPRDYHRVHMPVDGTLRKAIYVPGDLYSVNQTTAENVDNLFARNERLVALFDTEHGPMAMILVGAMIVAGIETIWSGPVKKHKMEPQTLYNIEPPAPVSIEKGAEMGRFQLGSTVILLFGAQTMEWIDSLESGNPLHLGERIGQYLPSDTGATV